MPTPISLLKKVYDLLGNDRTRAHTLRTAELLGVRKDVVRISTSETCNIRCVFCATHQVASSAKNIMSFDDFKMVIDKFAPTTRVLYLACVFEPLVTRDFHEYISYACKSGIPIISFPTNGLRMTDEIVHAMVDGRMSEIVYSIQGYERESYNRINYGSNFDRVISGLESLARYKREKNSQLPAIRINTILLASNLMNFGSLRRLIEKFDIKTVQFRELLVTPGQNNPEVVETEKISTIDPAELQYLLNDIKTQVQELASKGIDLLLPAGFADEGSINSAYVRQQRSSCCIPYFSAWIDCRGKVQICPFNDNPDVGNAFTDSMADIRKQMNQFRPVALKGKCNQGSCTINMDESQLVTS